MQYNWPSLWRTAYIPDSYAIIYCKGGLSPLRKLEKTLFDSMVNELYKTMCISYLKNAKKIV